MASADRVYVDPSALRSLYVHDDRSKRFAAWRKRTDGALVLTRHGYAEMVNSIMHGIFRGDLEPGEASGAVADLDEDLRTGRLILADTLWRRALELAAQASREHTARTGARTLDVLHVACAIVLERTTLVTYDRRQRALAEALGLRVVAP
ncbi:MAG: type II toxin-antitoxin system VapC family toxin [Sandaracinaceae bacterium]|nr:type II toxin-antitoxin system VapC family toxin [Sandaracinaceae bacterium]